MKRENECGWALRSGLLTVLTIALGHATVAAAPIELLKNGGFEVVSNNIPVGWKPSNAGLLSVSGDQKSGQFCAKYMAQEHEWGFCFFNTSDYVPVKFGAKYRVSVWAKGQGKFAFLLPQYTNPGMFIGSKFGPTHDLVPEWRRYEFMYAPAEARCRFITFGLQLFGKDNTAYFDDASFAFEPADNPGLAIDTKVTATMLKFDISARNARVNLFVNGKELPRQKTPVIEIGEGLTVVALDAVAVGKDPGVKIKLIDRPETDGRWRIGVADSAEWLKTDFNDKPWPVAAVKPDGYVWSTNASISNVWLRQVLIWNEKHTGPVSCINPPIREWGFSENSIEPLFLALYSPLPYPLENYAFILDVPACFALLDKVKYKPRSIMNQPASAMSVEQIKRNGQNYMRYTLTYPAGDVLPSQTRYSILPVTLDAFTMYSWWDALLGRDKTCRFYFRRLARGNITELEQSLPVRILPPIDGRMPKQVMISQYCSIPWGGGYLSPEHLKLHVNQSMRAGFNYWIINGWSDYAQSVHDQVVSNGGHITLWVPNNFPLYETLGYYEGSAGKGSNSVYQWLAATPEARARYFKDTQEWEKNGLYCPMYVTSAGAAKFREVVKREYGLMLGKLPSAEIIWNDWESPVWGKKNDGEKCWCFCDRCKQAFREYAQLKADADLSDDSIIKNYRQKWEYFREQLDGKVQGEIHKVCQDLGKPYMLYGGDEHFWKACRGNVDLAFPGSPGNGVADSHYQKWLDELMKMLRDKVGLQRAMGQRFSFFADISKEGWKKTTVLSEDNLVNARSWKSQVLRIVASLHGGVDLQSSLECVGGMQYYIGEATRIIAEYEPLFWDGERADDLAASDQIGYPNLLVLQKGRERLILLFNEGAKPLAVVLRNKDIAAGRTAEVYGTGKKISHPAEIKLTVPPEDVTVVHINE